MENRKTKQARLQQDIALLQTGSVLRRALVATVFAIVFLLLADILFQLWLDGKSLPQALRSFSRFKIAFMAIVQFCLYYFFMPRYEKKILVRKQAELQMLQQED